MDLLTRKLHVTGEIALKRHVDGRWFVEVASERELTEQIFAKLKGQRL